MHNFRRRLAGFREAAEFANSKCGIGTARGIGISPKNAGETCGGVFVPRGMNIQNSKKESVGQIKDIVVDPMTTRIQYVAVTYGGFLGLGDKMFAVPMQAIKVQQDPDNRDRVVLVLDVTKEQMNGAQGFDEANWPNFADEKFSGELHRRYRVEDRWNNRASRDGKVDVNIGRDDVEVNVDGKKK